MTKILIIDDSLLCQQVLELNLKSILPCSVEKATNGQEALDIINDHKSEFDLIFVDIKMPVMGGFEFAQKYNGNAKLICTTAAHPIHLKKDNYYLFDCLLTKPISKTHIKEIIELFQFQAKTLN